MASSSSVPRPALFFFFVALSITTAFSQSEVVNVKDSGANGDGKTDNAKVSIL